MEHYSYGSVRWKIIYSKSTGISGNALKLLHAGVSEEVPYVLVSEQAEHCTELSDNLIFLGTRDSNNIKRVLVSTDDTKSAVSVVVRENVFSLGKQMAVITGQTEADLIYAVSVFLNIYLPMARRRTDHNPYFRSLFTERMPEFNLSLSPNVFERGIWTWGHCIYDYHGFAQNMALLGLNYITIWNDFIPVNMNEVIDCFHSYGIKVLLGFAFGWEEEVDIGSNKDMHQLISRTVNAYEREYAQLAADGIYFQSFTETDKSECNGICIAEAVVDWVNNLSAAMHERWPEINMCFGVHATSVKNHLDIIDKIDKRVTIHWEDCGAFPYNYLSRNMDGFSNTQAFTNTISSLRNGVNFGAVLKGQVCIDWSRFENQKGPFILGCESKKKINYRMATVSRQWHDVQSFWMLNLMAYRNILGKLRGGAVYALVEDGLLEEHCWLPTVLYAWSMWNDTISDEELLQIATASPITFIA